MFRGNPLEEVMLYHVKNSVSGRGYVFASGDSAERAFSQLMASAWRGKLKGKGYMNTGPLHADIRRLGKSKFEIRAIRRVPRGQAEREKEALVDELKTRLPEGYNNRVGGALIDDSHIKRAIAKAQKVAERAAKQKAAKQKAFKERKKPMYRLMQEVVEENAPLDDPRWEEIRLRQRKLYDAKQRRREMKAAEQRGSVVIVEES